MALFAHFIKIVAWRKSGKSGKRHLVTSARTALYYYQILLMEGWELHAAKPAVFSGF